MRRRTAAALVVVAVLTGCSRGPVQLPAPQPDAAARTTCESVMTALPAAVLDQPRRDTRSSLTAAWGDPPITLSCGVAAPTGQNAASQCFEVNGVGWYAEQGSGGYLFDTIGRAVTVEVGVPDRYAPQANALVDLAEAISRHDPVRSPCL
ncbi:MAG: DUF3515 domain-containing protein [Propionibacteriaceae bacterium]